MDCFHAFASVTRYRGAIVTHATKGDGLKTTSSRVGSGDPDGPLVTKVKHRHPRRTGELKFARPRVRWSTRGRQYARASARLVTGYDETGGFHRQVIVGWYEAATPRESTRDALVDHKRGVVFQSKIDSSLSPRTCLSFYYNATE